MVILAVLAGWWIAGPPAVRALGWAARSAHKTLARVRGRTIASDLGLTDEQGSNAAWHYGGQGFELDWDGDFPVQVEEPDQNGCECTEDEYDTDENGVEDFFREGEECDLCAFGQREPARRRARSVWFNFDKVRVAETLRDAFTVQGFTVDWDGTASKAVGIIF